MQQKLLSWYLLPLVILYPSGFNLLNMPCFSQIPLMASLDIFYSGPPLRKYIKQYNLCVINCSAIFNELLSVASSVSECRMIKNFRELT